MRCMQLALAMVTVGAIVAYVALGLSAQLLTPGYDVLSMGVSALAVGPHSRLMKAGFVARGIAALALVGALVLALPAAARSPVGETLIVVWGLGAIVLAIYDTDMPGQPRSAHGAVHALVAAVAYVAVAAGELLVALRLDGDPAWRPLAPWATALAVVVLIALVAPFVAFGAAARSMTEGLGRYGGLVQRVFLGLALAWMVLVALRV
jgi:hypothetical protein